MDMKKEVIMKYKIKNALIVYVEEVEGEVSSTEYVEETKAFVKILESVLRTAKEEKENNKEKKEVEK